MDQMCDALRNLRRWSVSGKTRIEILAEVDTRKFQSIEIQHSVNPIATISVRMMQLHQVTQIRRRRPLSNMHSLLNPLGMFSVSAIVI